MKLGIHSWKFSGECTYMFFACLFVFVLFSLFKERTEVTEDIIICEAGIRQAGEVILRATFTIFL